MKLDGRMAAAGPQSNHNAIRSRSVITKYGGLIAKQASRAEQHQPRQAEQQFGQHETLPKQDRLHGDRQITANGSPNSSSHARPHAPSGCYRWPDVPVPHTASTVQRRPPWSPAPPVGRAVADVHTEGEGRRSFLKKRPDKLLVVSNEAAAASILMNKSFCFFLQKEALAFVLAAHASR
jgi:hypothetical protein